jgi:hypothetical protein
MRKRIPKVRTIRINTRCLPKTKPLKVKSPCEGSRELSKAYDKFGFKVVAARHGGKRRCKDCEFLKICTLRQREPEKKKKRGKRR